MVERSKKVSTLENGRNRVSHDMARLSDLKQPEVNCTDFNQERYGLVNEECDNQNSTSLITQIRTGRLLHTKELLIIRKEFGLVTIRSS